MSEHGLYKKLIEERRSIESASLILPEEKESELPARSESAESVTSDLNYEVLIGLWPYGNQSEDDDQDRINAGKRVRKVVIIFALIWMAYFVSSHARYFFNYGIIQFLKFCVLALVPLLCLSRGTTHLRFNPWARELLNKTVMTERKRKEIPWDSIVDVFVLPPASPGRFSLLPGSPSRSALDGHLCIETRSGQLHKLKLSKIADRGRWLQLLSAFERWCPVGTGRLDPELFDALSADKKSPTYTMLWLQALAAPPKRERLNPLSEGARMRQGRYTVEREIGAGGQGTAYLAKDASGRRVVLKEYILPLFVDLKSRRIAVERFEREASTLASLAHPGVVKLLDSFVDDHRGYLVLEYIEGETLKQMIERLGPPPEERCLAFARQMSGILLYLHNQAPPLVHGDFTPDNLILQSDGNLKLIDFMVATQESESANTSTTVVGKHAYMAPEQFRGQLTRSCDLYALGCCLFFLLTQEEPEPLTQQFPILKREEASPLLSELASSLTALDAGERIATIERVVEVLRASSGEIEE